LTLFTGDLTHDTEDLPAQRMKEFETIPKTINVPVIRHIAGKPEVGAEQFAWLKKDLARFPKNAPIVVLTHRCLFDLRPDWEWFTSDGDWRLLLNIRHLPPKGKLGEPETTKDREAERWIDRICSVLLPLGTCASMERVGKGVGDAVADDVLVLGT
jgi:hypothetical protein